MSYFTAVLARDGGRWLPRVLDVEDCESLADLTVALREGASDHATVLLLLEHEDEWFGVVRVDADDDPRVFLSDVAAATRSPYADALDLDEDGEEDGPYGDLEVVADLGTDTESLLELTGDDAPVPADALGTIAESAGFADVLDSMR